MKNWFKKLQMKLSRIFWHNILLFDRKYRENVYRTRKLFFRFYRLYSESLEALLLVKDELVKEVEKNYDKDFNKAILLLLSRSIQNSESIFVLIERGLYGSAFGLLRNVLSDMNMFYYLHYNPNLISNFMRESQESYQKDSSFRSVFNEGAINEDLDKRGVKSIKDSLQVLSKTMHASAWGAQLYGTEGKWVNGRGRFHAKYGPEFETKKALVLFTAILSIHWDYLTMILDHRYINKLDINSEFWKNVIKQVSILKPKILSLSNLGEKVLLKTKKQA